MRLRASETLCHPTIELYRRLLKEYEENSILDCVKQLVDVAPRRLVAWDLNEGLRPEDEVRKQIRFVLLLIQDHPDRCPQLKRKSLAPVPKQARQSNKVKRSYHRKQPEKSPEHIRLEQSLSDLGRLNPAS